MRKPNMYCGECPYWLAFGEPETTDEMNQAIEEHCAECDACDGRCFSCDYFDLYKGECSQEEFVEVVAHTPEKTGAAMKHISELMDKHRAEHPEVYEVNVKTDKYADLGFGENWVSESPEMPDEDREIAEAAQEAYDNLVRSLVEAGGEIRELNDEKRRLIFALKEAVTWLDYFLTTERDDIYYDDANEVRCRAEYLLMDLEG